MAKSICVLFLVGLCFVSPLCGDEIADVTLSPFSITLVPGVSVPTGNFARFYDIAARTNLSVTYNLPFLPLLALTLDGGYNLLFDESVPKTSMVYGAIGTGFDIGLGKFTVSGRGAAGVARAFSHAVGVESGGSITIAALVGGDISFRLLPTLSLSAGARYLTHLGYYESVDVFVGTTFHIPQPKPRIGSTAPGLNIPIEPLDLKVGNAILEPIFPVLFKHYDENAFGSVVIRNDDDRIARDVKVSFFVEEYMISPQECGFVDELKSGDTFVTDLYALFTDDVIEITQATRVAAQFLVDYKIDETSFQDIATQTIRIEERNSITWADDRRLAAFITAKDPAVMQFSKHSTAVLRDYSSDIIDENLAKAATIVQALSLFGINYEFDPAASYKSLHGQETILDYLQFPRHTLRYKAGDCDDLTILFCSLLESVSVETAFITVPGHILPAFALKMTPEEALDTLSTANNLIITEDTVWVPLEITIVNEGFLNAWDLAAAEWRDNKDDAVLYPTRMATAIYEPAFLPGEAQVDDMPTNETVYASFRSEIDGFALREIQDERASLLRSLEQRPGNEKIINRLGLLYVQYGLMDDAKSQFTDIISRNEYVPALINLGHISYIEKDFETAVGFYERAQAIRPTSSVVLLPLVRAYNAVRDYDAAERVYTTLKTEAPELAAKHANLVVTARDQSRATDVGSLFAEVEWVDE